MDKWLASKDEGEIKDYWQKKNSVSLDGLPTHILESEK